MPRNAFARSANTRATIALVISAIAVVISAIAALAAVVPLVIQHWRLM